MRVFEALFVLAILASIPLGLAAISWRTWGWPGLCDNLIRATLAGIPLVLLYYLQAWETWRFQWVDRPYHLIIWNVPAGCIATDHYPPVDWAIASVVAFTLITLVGLTVGGFWKLVRGKKRLTPAE